MRIYKDFDERILIILIPDDLIIISMSDTNQIIIKLLNEDKKKNKGYETLTKLLMIEQEALTLHYMSLTCLLISFLSFFKVEIRTSDITNFWYI